MPLDPLILDDLMRRVRRLEAQLAALSESPTLAKSYSVAEFSAEVRRSRETVREWARLGRVLAERRMTGCGPYREWVISHAELLRYRQEGLLPTSSCAKRGGGA